MTDRRVTVIGLGPMGQAMARAFLAAGFDVTVWNRTASRADELVAEGAARAADQAEALRANELVVLSLTDYPAMYTTFAGVPDAAFEGRVIANLSSDTPEEARKAAAWLDDRGAQQITGGVKVPPAGIGDPSSATFYSGPRAVVDRHRAALEVLTGVDYRGEEPGRAALHYQIHMDMFWTSLVSFAHALTVAKKNGIAPEDFARDATFTADSLSYFVNFYTPRVFADNHDGDVDRLAMGRASIHHVVDTVAASGVDTALPQAVADAFDRGAKAGFEDRSFSSLVEIFGNTAGR